MKKVTITTVRFDARTAMLIKEIAKKHNTSASAVIRMMCYKTIDTIIDEKGYISQVKKDNKAKGQDE